MRVYLSLRPSPEFFCRVQARVQDFSSSPNLSLDSGRVQVLIFVKKIPSHFQFSNIHFQLKKCGLRLGFELTSLNPNLSPHPHFLVEPGMCPLREFFFKSNSGRVPSQIFVENVLCIFSFPTPRHFHLKVVVGKPKM